MKRSSLLCLFIVLASLCSGALRGQPPAQTKRETKPAAPTTQYEITGVVINNVGGDPVARCHLTPTLTGHGGFGNRQFPAPSAGYDCDASGHFKVTVPSAGAWRLTVSARGFVSQAYDEHHGLSSAIVLTATEPTKDIEFRVSPEASIVGLVLDEAGEPVRNAQIALQTVPPPGPGGAQAIGGMRGAANTDDRGMYELTNLSPGEYRLTVHAQPWYAATAQQQRLNNTDTASLDPSLDFAYPTTWFPGVTDPALAETIVLQAGDTRQADFRLVPIPSIHLRILSPPRVGSGPNGTNAPQSPIFPIVQQVNSGTGGVGAAPVMTRFDQQGQIDIGGLTPGMYQIRLPGQNQEGHSALVEVSANSARTIDLSAPPHDVAKITLHFDGADSDSGSRPDRNGGLQITLIDRDNHLGSYSSNGGGEAGFGRRDQRERDADHTMEVPPGRYEVVLQGRSNLFLTGLTAKGAETAGRFVTVGAGDSTLTVHVASGRASLSGIATLDGKPCVGAMVLLVPVTIEDSNSITVLSQDQTNTDGSYDLTNIIPGQYILVAIDHGWQINWDDRSTLRRYLMQGVAVDLKSSAILKQAIVAQAP